MAKVIDLGTRLGRLSQSMQHRIGQRNQRLKADYTDKQARKAQDWQAVKDHHPDVAQHISDMGKVFGGLAMVRVTDASGGVLLDSRRYE